MSARTYHVVVTREGTSWLADVPAVTGTHTWAKNLPGLDRAVREAIALAEDLPEGVEGSLRLEYEYNIGDPELNDLTARLRAERARISREEHDLAVHTAAAAERLVTAAALSVRDAAKLLAVSPQRISQVSPKERPVRGSTRGGGRTVKDGTRGAASSPGSRARA